MMRGTDDGRIWGRKGPACFFVSQGYMPLSLNILHIAVKMLTQTIYCDNL